MKAVVWVLPLLLSMGIVGCGKKEAVGDGQTELSKLVGDYELFRSEITFVGQPKMDLLPPDTTGEMTISSNRKIVQSMVVKGTRVNVSGTFTLNLDDRMIMIDNDQTDIISKLKYEWDGNMLVTSIDVGTYFEKDFWKKMDP